MNLLTAYDPTHLVTSLLVLVVAEEGEVTLGTLVGEVTRVPTLEARDLVQGLEPARLAVSPPAWVHAERVNVSDLVQKY